MTPATHQDHGQPFPAAVDDLAGLVTDLQSLGLRVETDLCSRQGGAGPAEGGALIIAGRAVNAPTASPFAAASPYSLRPRGAGAVLCRDDQEIMPVDLVPRPAFYGQATADGAPLERIALLHGSDCLATTVIQTCAFWSTAARCRFCGIELSLMSGRTAAQKTPAQLAEAAARAKALDGVKHVVLTTGSGRPPGSEISHLAACARAVKQAAGLPVHAQFMPPRDLGLLGLLRDSGVDTAGIHIESFDPAVLARQAPAKAALGQSRFVRAWRRAVEVFGPGQVSSFLVAGLGEDPASLVQGAALLADLGAYPFLVPLRPIPGSLMAAALPPSPDLMRELYGQVADILRARGLGHGQSKAGCVRCGACSALPFYERPLPALFCHPARTAGERRQALAIRRQVFVGEQGLFAHDDQDPEDARAVHLLARVDGQAVGTVRAYPAPDAHRHWIGGRLAVLKDGRASGAAQLLVREAVRTGKRQGCTRFTAHIQERNVVFFRRLGWRVEGEAFLYRGRPHLLMSADLDKV